MIISYMASRQPLFNFSHEHQCRIPSSSNVYFLALLCAVIIHVAPPQNTASLTVVSAAIGAAQAAAAAKLTWNVCPVAASQVIIISSHHSCHITWRAHSLLILQLPFWSVLCLQLFLSAANKAPVQRKLKGQTNSVAQHEAAMVAAG